MIGFVPIDHSSHTASRLRMGCDTTFPMGRGSHKPTAGVIATHCSSASAAITLASFHVPMAFFAVFHALRLGKERGVTKTNVVPCAVMPSGMHGKQQRRP